MGEANLAEDTKLQHKLALKILPGNDWWHNLANRRIFNPVCFSHLQY
jgi:hypothetical protein